jgi:hypothetical protein
MYFEIYSLIQALYQCITFNQCAIGNLKLCLEKKNITIGHPDNNWCFLGKDVVCKKKWQTELHRFGI